MPSNDPLLGVDMSAGQDQSLVLPADTTISTGENEISLERLTTPYNKCPLPTGTWTSWVAPISSLTCWSSGVALTMRM